MYSVSQATNKVSNEASDERSGTATHSLSSERASVSSRLSCLIEGLSPEQRNRERTETLQQLNLIETEVIPVFDEATQLVSQMLAMPICILSVADTETQYYKSVVGLSGLGLMNELAASRTLPLTESFCTHIIDSGKTFALDNALSHPAFSHSLLVQKYGIHAYIGVPLLTAEGMCIGTLAAMDVQPRNFTQKDSSILELSARWCMSEFEKQHLQKNRSHTTKRSAETSEETLLSKINKVRFDLVLQLTQDLRSPLTSITGMANMLSREIYGPLSEKQREYTDIVLKSSQQLLSMVDEIVEVGGVQAENYQLSIATVDIEMLGQQAIAALESLASQQELEIKLTVEPSSRIWNLDKQIVKQLIYHLVFSTIKMCTAGSTIRLHVSRKDDGINIALWVSNPWLGEDLPQAIINWDRHSATLSPNIATSTSSSTHPEDSNTLLTALANAQKADISRQELGLLISQHLTHIHGGEAAVQGSASTGYRYIVTLPALEIQEQT